MTNWPKVKLGQAGVSSDIAQNHSSSQYEVISGHYWPQFTWKVDKIWNYVKLLFAPIWFYLPLFAPKIPFVSMFSLTYLHLPLFTYIWPNVAFITLILSYLPEIALLFTIDRYSSIDTAPLCTIFEQSNNYSWEILYLKELEDT